MSRRQQSKRASYAHSARSNRHAVSEVRRLIANAFKPGGTPIVKLLKSWITPDRPIAARLTHCDE